MVRSVRTTQQKAVATDVGEQITVLRRTPQEISLKNLRPPFALVSNYSWAQFKLHDHESGATKCVRASGRI